MGDPRTSRRKYQKPSHPWQEERIKNEDEYVRKYGLKNKREFWKAESMLRAQRAQAREYLPRVLRGEAQAKREADALLAKLNRLGVLQQDAGLDDVLALSVDSLLSRRLQTITYMKGLANTPNQARQFIVHGHVAIDGQRLDVPGYLVPRDEEPDVAFAPTSPLQNPAHPLRTGGDEARGVGAETAVPDEPEVEEPEAEEPEAPEPEEPAEEEAEEATPEEEAPDEDEAEEAEAEEEEPEPEEAEAEEEPEEEAEAEEEEPEPEEAEAEAAPEPEEEAEAEEEEPEPEEAEAEAAPEPEEPAEEEDEPEPPEQAADAADEEADAEEAPADEAEDEEKGGDAA